MGVDSGWRLHTRLSSWQVIGFSYKDRPILFFE